MSMATTTQALDNVDKILLAELQVQCPIDHRPFEILGQKLGISEQECVARIGRLKKSGVIRQVSAIFDARALGYDTTVAAMKVDPARADEAAQQLIRYPGVSNAYTLNDPFNLWSSVAVPPTDSLERVIKILHALAQVDQTILLPSVRCYKAGIEHDRTDEGFWLDDVDVVDEAQPAAAPKPQFTEQDLRFLRIVQEDLPLLELPFAVLAEQAESTEEELFAWLKRVEHLGYLRRFGAILSPPSEGSAHAIVVWQVPAQEVDAVGGEMARFREVSRCSRRPVYPNWPYALLTVIRASSPSACMEAATRIESRVGHFPHKHLFSTKAHQRARLTYFSQALETWWQDVGSRVDI